MACTHRCITHWNANNTRARTYSNLASNDEETIVRWLYQQGIIYKHCSGMECHDIGDTDYFCGSIDTDDIDTILAFMDRLYGKWTINATYEGIDIVISKLYPNILHHLSFRHPGEEETLEKLFERFERDFCHPDITETEEYR